MRECGCHESQSRIGETPVACAALAISGPSASVIVTLEKAYLGILGLSGRDEMQAANNFFSFFFSILRSTLKF